MNNRGACGAIPAMNGRLYWNIADSAAWPRRIAGYMSDFLTINGQTLSQVRKSRCPVLPRGFTEFTRLKERSRYVL